MATPETIIYALLPGLAIGAVVGAVAQYVTFCSVGAIADILLAGDWRRARSWMLAAAIALLGAQIAAYYGAVPFPQTMYRAQTAGPFPAIIGGVAFGYGMAMAGGCLQRALVRMGGGSLKSLMTTAVMVGSGLATVKIAGTLQLWGAAAWPAHIPNGVDGILAASVGIPLETAQTIVTCVVVLALLFFCVKDPWFRQSPPHLWGSILIGGAVVAAWLFWLPGEMQPSRGLNLFADLQDLFRPYFSLDDAVPWPVPTGHGFLVCAMLLGVILGSFAVAYARGDLMRDSFADRDDVKRHILGGLLMGFGGVLALGCTFGQGLSGLATLSVTSVCAIAAMVAGCLWGVRALEAGSAWGGLRLCFRRRSC